MAAAIACHTQLTPLSIKTFHSGSTQSPHLQAELLKPVQKHVTSMHVCDEGCCNIYCTTMLASQTQNLESCPDFYAVLMCIDVDQNNSLANSVNVPPE